MPTDLAQLEVQLFESLDHRQRHFEQAIELTESLPACLDAGDFGQSTLTELNVLLQNVAALERRASSLHAEWKRRGGVPGSQLSTRIQQVSEQIEELMRRFAQAEQTASDARERLKPQISQEVNSRRMLSAYQTH